MMLPSKIAIASGNLGKIREINLMFHGLDIEFVSQNDLGVSEVDEPYDTFLENALTKARHVSKDSGLPVLADDSGICVFALDGRPGVNSARFAGANAIDAQNNHHLIELMRNVVNRRAYYYCALVLVRHYNDPAPLVTDGRWFGELLDEPRGEGGFGYDPLFLDLNLDLTGAEMSLAQKNVVSHRGAAVHSMRRLLESGAY
ncbi:MAG: RdgB/HAM1 family non-canonical purine NTP pyrophosphatase [Proteobacteria bacterium]|nr:RdgB/HAM1 family non-canonical purine NTP pyrophosphatase [Pseudomonadota bacterium]MDA1332302.1 RdgB/HAM1 family non-canonical purine NTP pyrophosphatase [Pseudomonadota bacterium]